MPAHPEEREKKWKWSKQNVRRAYALTLYTRLGLIIRLLKESLFAIPPCAGDMKGRRVVMTDCDTCEGVAHFG